MRATVPVLWFTMIDTINNNLSCHISRLFFVIGLLVASVFPPISFMLTWVKVPAVRTGLGPPHPPDIAFC